MKTLLASICCLVLSGICASAEPKLGSGGATLRSGTHIVTFGVDREDAIRYLIIYPSNKETEMLTWRDDDGKGFAAIQLKYRGLIIDGPCKCHPLMIIDGDRIRRRGMKAFKFEDLLKLLENNESLKEFVDAVKDVGR